MDADGQLIRHLGFLPAGPPGVATVRLGLTGFSAGGLWVGLGVRWRGAAGKVLGGVLVALGLAMLVPFAGLVAEAILRGAPPAVPGPASPPDHAPG